MEQSKTFALNLVTGFFNGVFVSLFFLLKIRETRAAEALHKAEAERLLLSKQAMESELKLMQAQIEPHFLFNTLASVQFLTETDPPQATRLLGHLIAYLRAALPQMRARVATLGQEIELAEAYLNILKMRMGPRLDFSIDVPRCAARAPVPADTADLARRERDEARPRAARPTAATIDDRARAQDGDRVLRHGERHAASALSGAARPAGDGVGLDQRARAPRGPVRRARALLARGRAAARARGDHRIPAEVPHDAANATSPAT